ncbi:hypothetical protein MMC25_005670 [Agyrium rufum]|nr:hypothetical protein [Agyrium rufum]
MPRDKYHILNALNPIFQAFRPPRGKKQIYLPNFTITLLRTPHLPANYAQFLVPLNLNKFDLKDYLYNVYNVRALKVRSFVIQSRVQSLPNGAKYRPQAEKKMTVEMVPPWKSLTRKGTMEVTERGEYGAEFVWPPKLKGEDLDAFDKKHFDAASEYRNEQSKREQPSGIKRPPKKSHVSKLSEQARELREGKVKWQGTVDGVRAVEQTARKSR